MLYDITFLLMKTEGQTAFLPFSVAIVLVFIAIRFFFFQEKEANSKIYEAQLSRKQTLQRWENKMLSPWSTTCSDYNL